MTRCVIVAVVSAVFLGAAVRVGAQAPSPPDPIGADVFIGGIPRPEPDDNEPVEFPPMGGWQTGASIRKGVRLPWLQWTGAYASHHNDAVRVREVLGGVRVVSPWLVGEMAAFRGFAHALAGPSWSTLAGGASGGVAPQLVVGGGFDALLLRFQVDYVRSSHPGTPRHSGRGFVGAVVPLCFADCRPDFEDGLPLGRRAR